MDAAHFQVAPKYAETLGIPLLLGREIGLQDTAASTKVAVIQSGLCRSLLPR